MIPETKDGVTPQEIVLSALAELMQEDEAVRLSVGWIQKNCAWISAHELFARVGAMKFAMYCDFMALLQGLAIEEKIFLDPDPEHMETWVRVRLVGELDLQLCAMQD
jgi:hypothetical protein